MKDFIRFTDDRGADVTLRASAIISVFKLSESYKKETPDRFAEVTYGPPDSTGRHVCYLVDEANYASVLEQLGCQE